MNRKNELAVGIAILAVIVSSFVMAGGAKPPPHAHTLSTQVFQEYIPTTDLLGTFNLTFNLAGHDPGSDSLELHVVYSYIVGFNESEYGAFSASTENKATGLANGHFQIRFQSPIVSGGVNTPSTIHYSPITEPKIILWSEGTARFWGRHTWTVTTIS